MSFPIDYIDTKIRDDDDNISDADKANNYIYKHDIATSSWTGTPGTTSFNLKFLTPNWEANPDGEPLPTKQLGLFGNVGTSGTFTASVITDLINTTNNKSQVTYPLTSHWEIDMDYIASIEDSSISSNIELTNKVQVSTVTPTITLDTSGLKQTTIISSNVNNFSFITVSGNLPNIELVSAPHPATGDESKVNCTPSTLQFIKSENAQKIFGETVFTFYPANTVSYGTFSNPIKISSGDYTINIKYNFCDYNVTLNGLPSLESSPNPVIEISGYVGAEYNNLAVLTSGIVINYDANSGTNDVISTSALLSELTFNNSYLNLSLIDNILSGYSSEELNNKIRKYRN